MIQAMFDFKKALELEDKTSYLSNVLLYEFDCTKDRSRYHEVLYYSANKATGSIVDSWVAPEEWKKPKPETPVSSIRDYVCSKTRLE